MPPPTTAPPPTSPASRTGVAWPLSPSLAPRRCGDVVMNPAWRPPPPLHGCEMLAAECPWLIWEGRYLSRRAAELTSSAIIPSGGGRGGIARRCGCFMPTPPCAGANVAAAARSGRGLVVADATPSLGALPTATCGRPRYGGGAHRASHLPRRGGGHLALLTPPPRPYAARLHSAH